MSPLYRGISGLKGPVLCGGLIDTPSFLRDIIDPTFPQRPPIPMSKNLHTRSGFLSALFLFSFFSPCFPDTVSNTGVQFLKIPVGVRGAGMGGVFNGVADDVSTVYWNTAGLAQIQDPEINLLHLSYFLGV